ncbi:polysaccharide pyruvyl transferase family protein [Salinibacter sp.]|uniref:polysaccharide pyruvyl transferase family protein n=1 Tax=Salinibacter sp. TaxID=2065818 RepID=UPI0021E6DF54|nr:polysaccharide pyruvyl transferase family protein [Salinibacter sp.]
MANPNFLGLTTCPHHASGNVGDQLITEAAIKIIEHELGEAEFDVHFREEEFSSRLEYLNSHDAIILFGFPILESNTRPRNYRIAENLDEIDPPIIPIGAVHKFFPGTEEELEKRVLQDSTRSFLDRVIANCPDGKIPVRTEWVGQVLSQNGYDIILTGDPAWYDPETVGREFHKPETIGRLVFTPPHSGLYVEQSKVLLRRLGARYGDADRRMVLQSVPTDVDRELYGPAQDAGFDVYYGSHDTKNLEMYRESDLHVGYRKHGHLAHLRWRRPSVVLAEDSRAAGLNATLGAAGVRAYSPEPMVTQSGKTLRGSPNLEAIDGVLNFIGEQHANDWNLFDEVGDMIDSTFSSGMKYYVRNALGEHYQ